MLESCLLCSVGKRRMMMKMKIGKRSSQFEFKHVYLARSGGGERCESWEGAKKTNKWVPDFPGNRVVDFQWERTPQASAEGAIGLCRKT